MQAWKYMIWSYLNSYFQSPHLKKDTGLKIVKSSEKHYMDAQQYGTQRLYDKSQKSQQCETNDQGIKFSSAFQNKKQRVSNKDSKTKFKRNLKKLFVQQLVSTATPRQWMLRNLEVCVMYSSITISAGVTRTLWKRPALNFILNKRTTSG